jgi:hypothetical protein
MSNAANSRRNEGRLAAELHFYSAHKEEWLRKHRGEYVVVHGTTLLGFFHSWEDAFRSGVKSFGVRDDFLVKQVLAENPVHFVF